MLLVLMAVVLVLVTLPPLHCVTPPDADTRLQRTNKPPPPLTPQSPVTGSSRTKGLISIISAWRGSRSSGNRISSQFLCICILVSPGRD
ncbi:hypothetical protein E2C01_083685 [Portunus trituberculatus]|uniref:Secreted peptide n=1 Tax=Portunus trituberculatus TaxID=210409 RepID=A0A5B7J1X8_PORTR|nr:hypothetical protein [Portunus trituberculatus]